MSPQAEPPPPPLLSSGEVSAIVLSVLLLLLVATVVYFLFFRRCVVIVSTFLTFSGAYLNSDLGHIIAQKHVRELFQLVFQCSELFHSPGYPSVYLFPLTSCLGSIVVFLVGLIRSPSSDVMREQQRILGFTAHLSRLHYCPVTTPARIVFTE